MRSNKSFGRTDIHCGRTALANLDTYRYDKRLGKWLELSPVAAAGQSDVWFEPPRAALNC